MTTASLYHWQPVKAFVKRFFDVLFSSIVILLFSPLFIILALIVLFTSGWPVFYSQHRVGKNGKPFLIYKFRTMHTHAEDDGPQLSSEDDDRMVGIGKRLRKWRLDELPQFYNVLIGNMSIVGPRPERAYYVKQLKKTVPEYDIIFHVRPGITSSGMVHFGYASTLEEMRHRAVYDIKYTKKLSLKQDLFLLFKTIKVVLEGSGK